MIERWFDLMTFMGLPSNAGEGKKLIKAYSEKHRAYHTLDHLKACFRHLDNLNISKDSAAEIELAFWFHDAIYKPFSATNEEDSAEWAKAFMSRNEMPEDIIGRVFDLIILTKTHSNPETDNAAIMLDIDLSILGAPPTIYDKYEKNIRREYKRVPYFIYKKKRKEILQSFLNMKRIFTRDDFYECWEERARQNITKAILAL